MALRFKLSNGLTVAAEPMPSSRVVAFQVWVKVGSADEHPDEIGLAHLHEHMLFKGTAKRGLGQIARDVEAHGGEINAWTSFDQTVYHVVIASRFAELGLEVLSDAVRASAFDPQELSREIEVVCEEIKRSFDQPSRRASHALFSACFGPHPYGRPVIGDEAAVRSHTRERVLRFFHRHYRPENIVLAAAGDFSERTLREWAEKHLGGNWQRPPLEAPALALASAQSSAQPRVSFEPVKEAYASMAFAGPNLSHTDVPALDVLALLAGVGQSSKLQLRVKRELALVNDVYAFAYTPRYPGIFATSQVSRAEKTLDALLETARVLRSYCDAEVDPDELATAQSLVESDAVYQRETAQGMARKLGHYEAALGGIEKEAEYYASVAALRPRDIQDVAQRYLRPEALVLSALIPEGTAFDATAANAQIRDVLKTDSSATRPASSPSAFRSPAPAQSTRTNTFTETIVERLPSGALLIVQPLHTVPLFAVRASFMGGVRFETAANNGISALWARTLTRGTQKRTAAQMARELDSMAGSITALGGRSSLTLRGEFLSRHFERGFSLFGEVLSESAFSETEVPKERARQLDDIKARDDRPQSLAFELFGQTLFREHPYRQSTLGEEASVAALDENALREFHRRFTAANQAVLAVVGDVDPAQVRERANRFFAGSAHSAPLPTVALEPEWKGQREGKRVLAKAQTQLVLGFPGARVTDPWRRDLEVLSTLLSGQSGRLFLELRDKRSMAYSVSSVSVEGVDPGYFAVFMGTSPEKTGDALKGVRDELARLRDEKVGEAELLRAKTYLLGSHDIGLQRNGALASVMSLNACYGLKWNQHLSYADEIAEVTAERLRDVAARVIDFERCAVATVGP